MFRLGLAAALLLTLLIPSAAAAQDVDGDDEGEVLVRVNGSDRIEAGELLEVAVIVNGDLEVSGEVTGATVVVDGDVNVMNGARLDGVLVVVDGTLTLRDGSLTDADIYLTDDSIWIHEDGAVITGEVRRGEFGFDLSTDGAWQFALISFVLWLGSTLVTVLAALAFAGVGGRQLWQSARNVTSRAPATLLVALAFWVGLLLIMVPLALSGIGALLIPVIVVTGIAVWFLGYIAFGTRVGALMTGRRMSASEPDHPYLPAIAGTMALQFLLLIAMAGVVSGVIAGELGGATGLIFVLPALLLYVVLWLAGIIGGGALVLKAVNAWSADETA